jgi:redox-sensitive bicupin YhaK (pirin superfamily)
LERTAIWIEPATTATIPGYEQIRFNPNEKQNRFKHLAGPAAGNGAARINQDAHVFVAELSKGAELPYHLGSNRAAWVHVVRGEVVVNGLALRTGDAASVTREEHLALSGRDAEPSEILLFDLA